VFDHSKLPGLYWNVWLLAFVSVALWESFQPRAKTTRPTVRRWTHNGVFAALTTVVGVLFRTSPAVVAAAVSTSPYGLLNHSSIPFAVRAAAAVLILDFTRYCQHRLLHHVPLLWRLHQVHHSDEHFDLTTGVRVHPAETALVQGGYLCVVGLIAPPFEVTVVLELAAVIQNFFSHANARMHSRVEKLVRILLVTPEMHRVHHSVEIEEQNSNFGAILPWWDRLLGTYVPHPRDGHERLKFGLEEFGTDAKLTLGRLVVMPFGRRVAPNSVLPQVSDSTEQSARHE
jgi:sterol desaturase/sphingolipid hydroxylase (fatty acid hydroxylase superfamily)